MSLIYNYLNNIRKTGPIEKRCKEIVIEVKSIKYIVEIQEGFNTFITN